MPQDTFPLFQRTALFSALKATARTILSPRHFGCFSDLFPKKNKKNTFPICGTPWRHISRSELHQKCLVLLHSGSCLLLSWRRKNGPFSAHKLLAQDSCPSPSPARRGASGPPWCYLGSSGFFRFTFFDFHMSERFKKNSVKVTDECHPGLKLCCPPASASRTSHHLLSCPCLKMPFRTLSCLHHFHFLLASASTHPLITHRLSTSSLHFFRSLPSIVTSFTHSAPSGRLSHSQFRFKKRRTASRLGPPDQQFACVFPPSVPQQTV